MDPITDQLEQQQQQQSVQYAWPKQLAGVPLSRASSNSSSLGASPARPPKSDRRRSSASPESILQYASMNAPPAVPLPLVSSPASPLKTGEVPSPPAGRSSVASNLTLSTSPDVLASIKAGSTPITPSTATSQNMPPGVASMPISREASSYSARMAPALQRNPSASTAEILANTLDSYHADLSRETSSASSSRYSSSVPPSPALSTGPVASFTAGLDHQLGPTLGPLRIESTTGSRTTIIKPDKKKKGRTSSSGANSPFTGGISSEDVFGTTTDSNDDALSDVPSRASHRRPRAFSTSSRKEGKRPESQGVSSDEAFGRSTSPTSPRVPSLSNMLSGLRRQTSRPGSQTSLRADDAASRASSRASTSNASLSASASEAESVKSDKSRRSSVSGKRRNRFSDVLKRKTEADRAGEEEHLRILSELRLKALALASESDPAKRSSSSSSNANTTERINAELLVRDMEKQRLSRAETVSSNYSSGSGNRNNDDTITSPNLQKRLNRIDSRSSLSDMHDNLPEFLGGSHLPPSDRPNADVPLDADGSDEESNARKCFAAIGRRATLMPTSSHSSFSDIGEGKESDNSFLRVQDHYRVDDHDDRSGRAEVVSEERRRSTLTPAHVIPSEGLSERPKISKSHKRISRDMGPAEGTEADIEDEKNPLTSSVLDRRRSTIKAGQAAESSGPVKKSKSRPSLKRLGSRDSNDSFGALHSKRSPRTSVIIPTSQTYPGRPPNESLSSSTSIRSLHAETVLPPVRSSSRPDSPPSSGFMLDQRSTSMQSIAQHLNSREQSVDASLRDSLPMNPQHTREASISGRMSEPPSPTTPIRHLPMDRKERLTNDILTALHSPGSSERNTSQMSPARLSRRSSAEQAIRGNAARPELGYHRRSSSDMLALISQQRQKAVVGHHRRSSSTDGQQKALPAKPTMSERQSRRSSSFAKMQQQHYLKIVSLLTRNRPLPAAIAVKEELKGCRSAAERAVLYARKINDLAQAESGLVYWLSQARPSAPDVQDSRRPRHRGSVATVLSHSSSAHVPKHSTREDNASEAFPIRHNSQDVYKARDITQRTPSVAPSTMVPNNIPYPGVYEDSQTLRTGSAMSSNPPSSSSFRSQSHSFASAALNAAGLPKVGFFGGLGRKSSKRAPSSRHKASDGASGLSISGPIRAPSPDAFASSNTRSGSLRPSGPRASISASSSDRDLPAMQHYGTMPTTNSLRSLASIPQGTPVGQAPTLAAIRSTGSIHAYVTPPDEEALTAMADVLPQASKETLAKYLTACNGDQFAAISAYFEDRRRGES